MKREKFARLHRGSEQRPLGYIYIYVHVINKFNQKQKSYLNLIIIPFQMTFLALDHQYASTSRNNICNDTSSFPHTEGVTSHGVKSLVSVCTNLSTYKTFEVMTKF